MKHPLLHGLLALALISIPGAPRAHSADPAERPLAAGPDPREIPLPEIKTALDKLPGAAALPVRRELPDVLTMNDGTKVTTVAQWQKRRHEMLRTLEYYSVGLAPPPPGNVSGREVKTQLVAGGRIRYRLVHLTFGPGKKLGLNIGIFTPVTGGPFPTVIAQAGTPPGATPLPRLPNGPTQGKGVNVLLVVGGANPDTASATPPSATNAAAGGDPRLATAPAARGGRGGPPDAETIATTNPALARGYAYVMFNNNDCGEDTTLREADGSWSFRRTRFFPAYPGYDWGLLRAWAWGVSRVADYLETDAAIDRTQLIVTGVSRTGKSALVAAAFDERLMGAPVVTGGGGVGAYRFAGPRNSETLDIMERKYPNWWSPHLREFWGYREKLPFDQHWFLALCAPRPFIALEGDADVISYPEAVRQSILGARPAYQLFGAADRLGVNYAPHAHAFTADDWTALLDFADHHLLGKKSARRFDRFPTEAELDAALARSRPKS